jgi:hypothetical protein
MRFAELTTYLGQGVRLSMTEHRLTMFVAAVARDGELAPLAGLIAASNGRRGARVAPGLLSMLVLAALINEPLTHDWCPTLRRHWSAMPLIEGIDPTTAIDPFTGERCLGRALRMIFGRPVLAQRVIRVEHCPPVGLWRTFYRGDGGKPASIAFAAGVPRARALELMASSLTVALPGAMFADLSDAISSDARQRQSIVDAIGEDDPA